MKVKTADLISPALDWAVAVVEGLTEENAWTAIEIFKAARAGGLYWYSTDWGQGGPLIQREWIELQNGSNLHPDLWGACKWSDTDAGLPLWEGRGPTPLVAAMRCLVAANLGDEVDVPDELV